MTGNLLEATTPSDVDAGRTAYHAARDRVAESRSALDLGRKLAAEARASATAAAADDDGQLNHAADLLAGWVRAGGRDNAPAILRDAGRAHQRAATERHAAAMERALARIEADHAEAVEAERHARAALEAAADRVIAAEAESTAVRINALHAQARALHDKLLELCPDDLHRPRDLPQLRLSPEVSKALAAYPPPNLLDVPVDVLSGRRAVPNRYGERRRALIEGTDSATSI